MALVQGGGGGLGLLASTEAGGLAANMTTLVTVEEDILTHPYWLQWDIDNLVPDSWHYLVAAWMTWFGILGTLGNFLIIYIFGMTKGLRTPSNFLLVNLAVSDMSFSAINGFPLLTISAINKRWAWGRTFCELYGFAGAIFGFISINSLAWIAYERYMVISNPLQASARMTKGRSFIIVMLVWAWSALWAVPPLMGWGAYVPEGFQTSCTFDYLTQDMNNYTMVLGMYFFAFLFPVFMIIFCYMGIYGAIVSHHNEMRKTAEQMGAKVATSDKDRAAEIQIAKVGFMSVMAFNLSWTPYAIVGGMGMMYPHSAMVVTPLMSEVSVMAAKASAAYNPLIYALAHPKFRTEVDKRFPWLLACCKPKPKPAQSKQQKVERESSMSQVTEAVEMSAASPTSPVNPAVTA